MPTIELNALPIALPTLPATLRIPSIILRPKLFASFLFTLLLLFGCEVADAEATALDVGEGEGVGEGGGGGGGGGGGSGASSLFRLRTQSTTSGLVFGQFWRIQARAFAVSRFTVAIHSSIVPSWKRHCLSALAWEAFCLTEVHSSMMASSLGNDGVPAPAGCDRGTVVKVWRRTRETPALEGSKVILGQRGREVELTKELTGRSRSSIDGGCQK